jgi:hypothetical protein
MCRTVDPDGDRLLFRMDLDGDGAFEFLGSSGADCRHEKVYSAGTVTATQCVTDVNCPSWPLCNDYPPLHPYECRSYTVTAVPELRRGPEPNTSGTVTLTPPRQRRGP